MCSIPVFKWSLYRERQQQQRTLRRQDKKMKELLAAVEEERRQADQFKQMVRHLDVTYVYDYVHGEPINFITILG